MKTVFAYYSSPIGTIEISGNELGISGIYFKDFIVENKEIPEILKSAYEQLDEYFQKKRKEFDFKMNPKGTDFQMIVWEELKKIPYGTTISYLELAKRVKNQKYTRAVANANSRNPISIVVPCHRVIGNNGTLTGYAGGLHRKKFLINLENNYKLL